MAVGVILVAALPAAAASLVNPTYVYTPSEAYVDLSNRHLSAVQLYEAKPYRLGLFINFQNNEGGGWQTILLSSTNEFRFSEGYLWTNDVSSVTVTTSSGYHNERNDSWYESVFYTNSFSGYVSTSSWQTVSGDNYSGWSRLNLVLDPFVIQKNPDADAYPLYNYNGDSSIWYAYDNSTEMKFYTFPADNKPIGSTTDVSGGSGRSYEDYFSYDYEVDENGDYVSGSGNINFDFGAGDKVKSFFNKGFFGEIRTWIQEGNDGAHIEPMTLFAFDTSFGGHDLHSDGFTLDFDDHSSFLSLLAFIVFPIYAFEILCNLWGLAFKILTGVPLLHISDSSVSVPLPDDDSAYLL